MFNHTERQGRPNLAGDEHVLAINATVNAESRSTQPTVPFFDAFCDSVLVEVGVGTVDTHSTCEGLGDMTSKALTVLQPVGHSVAGMLATANLLNPALGILPCHIQPITTSS